MEHMNTMTEVVADLDEAGFTAQFLIGPDGLIVGSGGSWPPENVVVERTVRLEGMSNPDDESIIMAIRAGDVLGTLILPYGPDLSGAQADTVRALAQR